MGCGGLNGATASYRGQCHYNNERELGGLTEPQRELAPEFVFGAHALAALGYLMQENSDTNHPNAFKYVGARAILLKGLAINCTPHQSTAS
jgi:hypothetical protein